nr:hypothetical protein CFP56_16511 [Quercus suber]
MQVPLVISLRWTYAKLMHARKAEAYRGPAYRSSHPISASKPKNDLQRRRPRTLDAPSPVATFTPTVSSACGPADVHRNLCRHERVRCDHRTDCREKKRCCFTGSSDESGGATKASKRPIGTVVLHDHAIPPHLPSLLPSFARPTAARYRRAIPEKKPRCCTPVDFDIHPGRGGVASWVLPGPGSGGATTNDACDLRPYAESGVWIQRLGRRRNALEEEGR